jgi:hypothetical protein
MPMHSDVLLNTCRQTPMWGLAFLEWRGNKVISPQALGAEGPSS